MMFQPENPFSHLSISSTDVLSDINDRSPCPRCHKSKMYFCYNCCVPVEHLRNKLPQLKLPLSVDVVRHPGETIGKSTAVHAALLAPGDVALRTFPDVPQYSPDDTVLVFPGAGAGSVAEVCAEFRQAGRPLRRAVFLDCTWPQCRRLLDHGRLAPLRCCRLADYETRFWRHQRGKPRTHLATIEAVYYFLREVIESEAGSYHGQCDDLLFFFDFFYKTVLKTRPAGTLWAYKDEALWTRPGKAKARRADRRFTNGDAHAHLRPQQSEDEEAVGDVGALYCGDAHSVSDCENHVASGRTASVGVDYHPDS